MPRALSSPSSHPVGLTDEGDRKEFMGVITSLSRLVYAADMRYGRVWAWGRGGLGGQPFSCLWEYDSRFPGKQVDDCTYMAGNEGCLDAWC